MSVAETEWTAKDSFPARLRSDREGPARAGGKADQSAWRTLTPALWRPGSRSARRLLADRLLVVQVLVGVLRPRRKQRAAGRWSTDSELHWSFASFAMLYPSISRCAVPSLTPGSRESATVETNVLGTLPRRRTVDAGGQQLSPGARRARPPPVARLSDGDPQALREALNCRHRYEDAFSLDPLLQFAARRFQLRSQGPGRWHRRSLGPLSRTWPAALQTSSFA